MLYVYNQGQTFNSTNITDKERPIQAAQHKQVTLS